MRGDMARERVRGTLGDELFGALEAQVQHIAGEQRAWEGDVLPIEGGAKPETMVILAAGPMIVHVEALPYLVAKPEERAAALAQALSAAARNGFTTPRTLHVRTEELAAALEPLLRARGIAVQAGALPAVDEAMASVRAGMDTPADVPLTTPDTWRETGASARELAAFHEAAAAFYRLAPWNEPAAQDPLLLELPDGARWAASVMGDGGVAYGLALYSEPVDMITLMMTRTYTAMEGHSITVDYDQRGPLTAAMLREITAAGWPVAGPRAYPRLFGLNLPEGRVQAEHVRTATLCLRAVTALARGADPRAECGVSVMSLPLPFDGDESEDEEESELLDWFRPVPSATPICAEGPGASPLGGLRPWEDYQAVGAAERERVPRLVAWLHGHLRNVRKADEENARLWCEHLAGMALPAGAVTEHDLRLYVYDLFIRKCDPSKRAVKALRTSLFSILRFFEEEEGIRYPFAQAVLEELWEVEMRANEAGMSLHDALVTLSYEVYDDLDARALLHERDPDLCAGWPSMMNRDVARLDHELQRRWLAWYDDLVRGGMTDYEALRDALLEKQCTWEQAPHADFEGRTPAEVIRAFVESETIPG